MSRARSLARHKAVQALYQWQVSQQDASSIDVQFHEDQDLRKVDVAYFQELLHQIPQRLAELDAGIAPLLDRGLSEVDPVERVILRIGAYELQFRPDIPYRVVINEAIEMAKTFGGEQGHKYVNSVLDKLARKVRVTEMKVS